MSDPDQDGGAEGTVPSPEYRQTLGQFATGVTVVGCRQEDGTPVGTTVNAFTALSLDPPLVLVCLDRGRRAVSAISESGCFGVSVLAAGQAGLSRHFARTGNEWPSVPWTVGAGDVPLLDEVVAQIACTLERLDDGGDHVIAVGRVIDLAAWPDRRPLVYHQGRYVDLPLDAD